MSEILEEDCFPREAEAVRGVPWWAPPGSRSSPASVCGFTGWQIVGGAASTLPLIVVRELIDSWPIESVGDMLVDSAVIFVGGVLGGLVFWAVA